MTEEKKTFWILGSDHRLISVVTNSTERAAREELERHVVSKYEKCFLVEKIVTGTPRTKVDLVFPQ